AGRGLSRSVRRLVLRPGREGPARGGHPWIFSGAVASGLEGAEPGEPVTVHAADGRFVAAGYCHPRTPIAVRVLTLDDEPAGEAPPPRLTIVEDGARFLVDVLHGQKTGFLIDQRESRVRVRSLARGRRVLNAFAYTGAFAIVAGLGGATEVVSVDTSRPALA